MSMTNTIIKSPKPRNIEWLGIKFQAHAQPDGQVYIAPEENFTLVAGEVTEVKQLPAGNKLEALAPNADEAMTSIQRDFFAALNGGQNWASYTSTKNGLGVTAFVKKDNGLHRTTGEIVNGRPIISCEPVCTI